MAVVGGPGTVWGGVAGAVIDSALVQVLDTMTSFDRVGSRRAVARS
jgi:ABC-type branched-subunit amino acid transport system permease subunit